MDSGSNGDVAGGLANIRWRRRTVWWLFYVYVPVVGLVYAVSRSNEVTQWVALGWLAVFAFAAAYAGFSKCPGCGKTFNVMWCLTNSGTGQCRHCDLRLSA